MTHTKRIRRVCKTPGHRICNKCERELPATLDVFVRDSSRPLGIGYECKECHATRRKGRDRSKELVGNLNEEQKEKRRATANRYASKPDVRQKQSDRYYNGERRAHNLLANYRAIDAKKGHFNDLTTEWFMTNIFGKACVYCEAVDVPIGCDRIDNAKGHEASNVQPCCRECNTIRGNRFSVEEMKIVAEAMKAVRKNRQG